MIGDRKISGRFRNEDTKALCAVIAVMSFPHSSSSRCIIETFETLPIQWSSTITARRLSTNCRSRGRSGTSSGVRTRIHHGAADDDDGGNVVLSAGEASSSSSACAAVASNMRLGDLLRRRASPLPSAM